MLLRQADDGLVFDRMVCNHTLVIAPTETAEVPLGGKGYIDGRRCTLFHPWPILWGKKNLMLQLSSYGPAQSALTAFAP